MLNSTSFVIPNISRHWHTLRSLYRVFLWSFMVSCGLKFSYISGCLWRCLYAGRRNEMESFATYAKTRLPYRVCMGYCQQFNYYHWRYNRKAPSDEKDDPCWGALPIWFRLYGTILLFPLYIDYAFFSTLRPLTSLIIGYYHFYSPKE